MVRSFQAGTALLMSACFLVSPVSGQEQSPQKAADEKFVLIPEQPSSVFVDATSSYVPQVPALHTSDSVFIDVDHDGDLDVVVSVELGINRLYINEGGGRLVLKPGAFRQTTGKPSVFGDSIHDTEHVRAADFDGDGNMDVVFIAEEDQAHELFMGDGKGGFKDASDRLPAMSQGNGLALGDVNGDKLPDIVIGSTGEVNHGEAIKPAHNLLFLNDRKHPGHFIDVSRTNLPQVDDQTEGVVLADMDKDGDLDMLLASPTNTNRLLINDGKGRFKDGSAALDLRVPMETREVHVADVDGDGDLDIFYSNITSNNHDWEKDPQTRLLINDGAGHWRDETAERLPAHKFSSWASTVIDFNGDGAPDLLLSAIQVPGFVPLQLRAWQNDGKGHFTDVTADVVPGVTVGRSWNMAKGDLDGDGKDDVFIGGWGTQARLLLTDQKRFFAGFPIFMNMMKPKAADTAQ